MRKIIHPTLCSAALLSGCLFSDDADVTPVVPPDAGNNAAVDSGSNNTSANVQPNNTSPNVVTTDAGTDGGEADMGDPFEGYGDLADVTSYDSCSLGGDAFFVSAQIDQSFPAEAGFGESSMFAIGDAPAVYKDQENTTAFSVAWANTEGANIHVFAGTAVAGGGATTIESQVYSTFSAAPGVEVTAMTVAPKFGIEAGVDQLYEVTLFTSSGVYKCQSTQAQADQTITELCEPDTGFNDLVTMQSLGPVREMQAFPLITMNDVFTYVTGEYMFAGNGGEGSYRLGAVYLQGLQTSSVNFPDIVAIQDSPFYERLVPGVSEEANRAPYIMAMVGNGADAEPRVLTTNAAVGEYTIEVDGWSLPDGFGPAPGRFSFVSSLDVTVAGQALTGPRIDRATSDAEFGYVMVLEDGSLGFSRPGGWSSGDFLRWVPEEAIEEIWAFDNLAWMPSPGEPMVLARTVSGALTILRWDVNLTVEVIPDALAGASVDSVLDARANFLVNHNGSIGLKVERNGSFDLALLPLQSVRDFTDALCMP